MRWPRREEEDRRLVRQSEEQNHQDRAEIAKGLRRLLIHLKAKERYRNAEKERPIIKAARQWLTFAAIAGACIFAGSQWFVMRGQLTTLQGQLQEMQLENRPWVGPTSAGSDQPRLGTELKVSIVYGNQGKEPASNARYIARGFGSTEPADAPIKLEQAVNDYLASCKAGHEQTNRIGVVYPTSGSTYTAHATFPAAFIDEDAISGVKILAVAGCLLYDIRGVPHHSTFCFDWKETAGPPNAWFFCATGNDAD